jgi:hypothetical protein
MSIVNGELDVAPRGYAVVEDPWEAALRSKRRAADARARLKRSRHRAKAYRAAAQGMVLAAIDQLGVDLAGELLDSLDWVVSHPSVRAGRWILAYVRAEIARACR